MSRKGRFAVPIAALSLFSAAPAFPAGLALDHSTELQLYGDFRHFDEAAFTDYPEVADAIGIAGENLRASAGAWQLEVRPELRVLQSPALGATDPNDVARISVAPPPRFLDLDAEFVRTDHTQVVGTIERLALSWQGENAEVYVGRRPISLGVLKVFPVWNKFTRVLPFQPSVLQFNASDGAGARIQFGSHSFRVATVAATDGEADGVALGEYTFYGPGFDVLALGGRWWGETAAGLAFSADLRGVGVRNEFLAVGLGGANAVQYQDGLGAEYAWNEALSTLVEFLWQSEGEDTREVVAPTPRTRYMPLKSKYYAYANGTLKLGPLWSASLGGCLNAMDGSFFAIGSVARSISDQMDLLVELKAPLGPDQSEFSPTSYYVVDDLALGYPYSVAATLKWAF